MALKLTRKGIIISIALFLLIAGGITGYIVWRVNQDAQLSEEDADAGGSKGGTCGCTCGEDGLCGKGGDDTDGKGNETGGNSCKRYNCQDYGGGWVYSTNSGGTAAACGSCGYSDTPVKQPNPDKGDCSCEKYVNSNGKACGVNCTFPSGTQGKVDNLAQKSCKAYIAMCKPGGIITYEVFNSSHVCWGLESQCKNPVGKYTCEDVEKPQNICDGGELIESGKTTFNEGESVEIKGYAFDKDGVDKTAVAVKVNGVTVGNATVTDACPSGNTTVCSAVGASNQPILWSYTFIPQEGENTVSVSWKDSKGVGGSNCQASTKVTSEPTVDTNPDWEVAKAAAGICLNDNTDDASFRVNYTITVTNTGDGSGEIDKVVDTLDSKVLTDYILTETFEPSGTLSGNVITWDLSGSAGTFAAGESKTYKYSIEVPNDAFGTYTNTVVVTTVEADTISDTEIVAADCDVPETPETGIFDNWLARIGFGFLLISAALAYISYMDGFNDKVAGFVFGFSTEGRVASSRKRFEKKVVK